MKEVKMPKLEPVPIQTKGLPFYKRFWRWVTYVRKWRVVEDWYYELSDHRWIVIERGFIFDGASIPKPLWAFLSPTGLLFIPGIIHDYAYKHGCLRIVWPKSNGTSVRSCWHATRKTWDDLFKNIAIEVNGYGVIDTVAWSMVRAFGDIAWKKHRKKD